MIDVPLTTAEIGLLLEWTGESIDMVDFQGIGDSYIATVSSIEAKLKMAYHAGFAAPLQLTSKTEAAKRPAQYGGGS